MSLVHLRRRRTHLEWTWVNICGCSRDQLGGGPPPMPTDTVTPYAPDTLKVSSRALSHFAFGSKYKQSRRPNSLYTGRRCAFVFIDDGYVPGVIHWGRRFNVICLCKWVLEDIQSNY